MISQDFKEFVRLLNEKQIEYLIVGGYAVSFHGYPRYTGDIDIWIKTSSENAEKMPAILDDFGFGSFQLTKDDFLNADNIIQLGYPPNRIDIITSIDGVNFEECYINRVVKKVDEIEINFIGLADLIKNKKATGRDRDIIDLKNLS